MCEHVCTMCAITCMSFKFEPNLKYMKWGFWLKRLKPKTTSLHARHHKTEFRVRGVDTGFVCFEYVYTLFIYLNMLTIDIYDVRRLCALVFIFFYFSRIFKPI